jgi:single-stranded-DNA-specific exonuclease
MRPRLSRRAVAATELGDRVPPILARLYAARGLTCEAELDLSLERLAPIGSLESVAQAADLLASHRAQDKKVLIVGDFDADGATSTALMVRGLRALGFASVDYLVPNRFTYGYGLTPAIVTLAAERGPTLIVTVDNGISSHAGIAAARARGIDVLVTDHHLPGGELPPATLIVNPNLPGSRFASRALAGVGVAFYVLCALARRLGSDFRPADLLDLVALGTVADMVPFDANNRILVAQGLKRIRAGRTQAGVAALLASSGRRRDQAIAADLGFGVAPRLNAAGRLTDMSLGIECLLTDDAGHASALAEQLGALNRERRDIEQRMQQEAAQIATHWTQSEALGVVLYDPSWHQGVVGLVAGRIKDRTHRPVVAFAPASDGQLRGSARSVPGVHVRDALEQVAARHPGLIEKFGGHAMAAGLSLALADLERFRAAFDQEVRRICGATSLSAEILTDGELTVEELTLDTARLLRDAGPWGQGFAEPAFDGIFMVDEARVVGGRHLKLQLSQLRGGARLEAMCFGHQDDPPRDVDLGRGARLQIAYRLAVNEWNGRERLQLNCDYIGAGNMISL